MAIADHDLTVIQQWCAGRVPDHAKHQVEVIAVGAADSVTIVERRPDWMDPEAEWSESSCARLQRDATTTTWTLWWFDSDSRARRYVPSSFSSLGEALDEIERDPDGAFWG